MLTDRLEEFNRMAREFDATKKVQARKEEYVAILSEMSASQFETLIHKLESDEEIKYFPRPRDLRTICRVYKTQGPKTDERMQHKVFDPIHYCRDCLDVGLVSAYEPSHENSPSYHQVAYRCRCSHGDRFQHLPRYFDAYPDYQFSYEGYENYQDAYLAGMYAMIEKRHEAKNASQLQETP